MKRFIYILILFCSASFCFSLTEVQCLFSFYVKPARFRGGYVISDRKILYRNAQYFGKIGSGTFTRFSGYYLIRFTFFRPVTPIAVKTDGGSAYLRINNKRILDVPSADQNFSSPGKGKILDIFTSTQPTYVKIIVKGKGFQKRDKKKGEKKNKWLTKYKRKSIPGSGHVATLFRNAFKTKKTGELRPFFGKRKIFLKIYMPRKKIFKFTESSIVYGIFLKDWLYATKLRIRSGYNKIKIYIQNKEGKNAQITLEKGFAGWSITSYRQNQFAIPTRYRKYRRRRYNY